MSGFFFGGNQKVTFIPAVPGVIPTVADLTSGPDLSCDCGCEDIEREPMTDLTFYREDPRPADVSQGYLVLRRGGQAAEVANMAMIHDGDGRWVGDIDHASWREVEIVEEP